MTGLATVGPGPSAASSLAWAMSPKTTEVPVPVVADTPTVQVTPVFRPLSW